MGSRIAIVAPSAAICASDRSTKITPRSTTCRPRYAWMPAMIRLAAMAGARNCRIVQSTIRLFPSDLFERARQQPDVVVDQLDVIAGRFLAANRRRQHQDLAADLIGNGLRRLQVEVRLDDDQLRALPLHFGDQLDGVSGCRRNARLRLDVSHHVETESVHEVRPRAMV